MLGLFSINAASLLKTIQWGICKNVSTVTSFFTFIIIVLLDFNFSLKIMPLLLENTVLLQNICIFWTTIATKYNEMPFFPNTYSFLCVICFRGKKAIHI